MSEPLSDQNDSQYPFVAGVSVSSNLITALREEGQDTLADAAERGVPFDQWSTEMQVEWDKALYGTAFTLDGKRIDPTKVVIHRRILS